MERTTDSTQATERKHTMETKYERTADTAKIIRKVLKVEFPGVKFSVRSSVYAGGASIRVNWTDGPFTEAVDAKVKSFAGGSFDGMTDSMSYHAREEDGVMIQSGADFVFTNRDRSETLTTDLEAKCQATYKDWEGPNGINYHREMAAVEHGESQLHGNPREAYAVKA